MQTGVELVRYAVIGGLLIVSGIVLALISTKRKNR